MSVKAKFVCNELKKYVGQESVTLVPVTTGSEENKSFSEYTPSGKLELVVTNKALFDHFQPGKEYYLTIEAAE